MYELYHLVLNAESEEKQKLLFTVTLLDDDPLFREQLKDNLNEMKITNVETYSSGEEFLAVMKDSDKRLVVCDFDFGSPTIMNGLQVLESIRKINPDTPVILLSSQDNMAVALQALRSGAADYFIKGTENAFTSVLTSIIKINELQRLKKNEKDYFNVMIAGSLIAILIIALLVFKLYN